MKEKIVTLKPKPTPIIDPSTQAEAISEGAQRAKMAFSNARYRYGFRQGQALAHKQIAEQVDDPQAKKYHHERVSHYERLATKDQASE